MGKAKHILDYLDMKKTHTAKLVITCGNSQLTYSELLQKAQVISDILVANGIKSGDIIAIYLPRSIETIISIFAVIFTGCAYVPIDIRSPDQRIKYILNDALPTCIVTKYDLVKNLPDNEYNIFDIDSQQYQYQSNKKGNKVKNNILYVMYTSGSTGFPKGVLGTHEGLINRIEWMESSYPILESDICCFNTSPSFVDSVAEIFSPLAAGARLHIMSNESAGNLELLVKEIYHYRLTRLLLGPSVLQMLLSEVDNIQNMFSHINFFAVSGEEITIQTAKKFRQLFPNVRFVNLYGSTEVAADALYYEIPPNLEVFDRIPIGKPIKNMQVSLLYNDNVVASQNSTGEICLSGIGLAQGYLNVTKIGSNKFIVDDSTGSLIYRTGDIGYFSEDKQTLMYLGRQDDQIKINGQKIHLKEIERVALNHKDIKDVAVVTSEMMPVKVVMYVVMKNNLIESSIKSIQNHMKQHVPAYMIPNLIVPVKEIPTNTNGKKDYYLMHQQATDGASPIPSFDTPKSVIDLFKYIFKTDDISLDTDFFVMGGNSLVAAMFCSKLNKIFNIPIDISILYKLSTVQNISEYVEKQTSLLQHYSRTGECVKGRHTPTEDALVFFSPLLGYPYCYYELSKHINRYSVYLLGENLINVETSNSLKDMAVLYAKYIVNNIKANKFKLIGWSFGGILAYECAIQLQSIGKEISEVVLLDSYNPFLFSDQDQEAEKQEVFGLINTKIDNFDTKLIKNKINRNINFLWQHMPSQSNFKITLVKASSYNHSNNYLTSYSDNGWGICSSKKIVIVHQDCDHFDMLNTQNIPFLLDLLQN